MIATCPRCKTPIEIPEDNTNPNIECPICHTVFLFLPPRKANVSPLQNVQQVHVPDAFAEMEKKSNRNKIIFWSVLALAVLIGGGLWARDRKAKELAQLQENLLEAQERRQKISNKLAVISAKLQTLTTSLERTEKELTAKQQQKEELQALFVRKYHETPEEPPEAETSAAPQASPQKPALTDQDCIDQIQNAQQALQNAQEERLKIECHHKCYRPNERVREEYTDNKGRTKYRWRTYKNDQFNCPKHGYSWSNALQYLDYSNQRSSLDREIQKQKEAIRYWERQRRNVARQTQASSAVSPRHVASRPALRKKAKPAAQIAMERQLQECEQKIKLLEAQEVQCKAEISTLEDQKRDLKRDIRQQDDIIFRSKREIRKLNPQDANVQKQVEE